MNPLLIEATDDSPFVSLNNFTGVLEISGRSLPEDVHMFYEPVFFWLGDYLKIANDKTILRLKIEYVNSASQRAINKILSLLEPLKDSEGHVQVEWHYHEDDEDMLETGTDLSEVVNLPFSFVSYVSEE